MANIRLANKCSTCSSWNWCGRHCASETTVAVVPKPIIVEKPPDIKWSEPEDPRAYDATVPPNTDVVVFGDVVIQVSGDALGPGTSGTYRYRNPDQRRAYIRELMRRKRAKV